MTPIIEVKWHQKRKQEAEERRLQKKRREWTSEEEEAPDSQTDGQSHRNQSGYQNSVLGTHPNQLRRSLLEVRRLVRCS